CSLLLEKFAAPDGRGLYRKLQRIDAGMLVRKDARRPPAALLELLAKPARVVERRAGRQLCEQQAQPEALAHHLLDLPERIRGFDRGPPPSHGRQPRRRAGVTPTGKAVATDAPLHPRIDRSLPWRFPGPSRTR